MKSCIQKGNGKLENSWYEWISGIWLLLIMRRYVNLIRIQFTSNIHNTPPLPNGTIKEEEGCYEEKEF
ncbi:hypothetical protein ABE083_30870, partial [Bacillus mycoides]|uniref:hypothetical protein n=1 Tax=Bacillus mycoides TaxID=1405 RepID=UPI003D1E2AE8